MPKKPKAVKAVTVRASVPAVVAITRATTAEIIRAIAMDIGKEVVHHIETMYPDAAAKLPGSGKLSVRNCVHNEIMAAIGVTDEGQIVARLRERKEFRRKMKKAYSHIRTPHDTGRN